MSKPGTATGQPMQLKLSIIIGSTRPGRAGPAIATWAYTAVKKMGKFDVRLVDLADFSLPMLDEPAHPALKQYEHAHTKRWSECIELADAFLFVAPEYDYFVPASLVNAIQVLFHEWKYKPAAIVSYGGVSAGLRGAQELRQLLGNLNVMALSQSVPLPFFPKFITEDGVFTPSDLTLSGMETMHTELHKWAAALKPMRAEH